MKSKVLLIDDDQNLVDGMARMLQLNGYAVVSAADGSAGLEMAVREQPNLIILDIMMPKMDGYTFLMKARRNHLVAEIPVIVLTGREKLEELCKEAGDMVRFLVKPIEFEHLLENVQDVLGHNT